MFENKTLPDGDIEKELLSVCCCCCCIECDRNCYEIESCEFHHTLNANILGVRDLNLIKNFFLGISFKVNYYV